MQIRDSLSSSIAVMGIYRIPMNLPLWDDILHTYKLAIGPFRTSSVFATSIGAQVVAAPALWLPPLACGAILARAPNGNTHSKIANCVPTIQTMFCLFEIVEWFATRGWICTYILNTAHNQDFASDSCMLFCVFPGIVRVESCHPDA